MKDVLLLVTNISENDVGTNWTSHLRGLETLFQAWNITSQCTWNFIWFLSLSQALQGKAKQVAPQERNLGYLNFSEYSRILKTQFCPPGHQTITLTKFHTAKQQHTETIDNWFERVTQYYKETDHEPQDSTLINAFIKGLCQKEQHK